MIRRYITILEPIELLNIDDKPYLDRDGKPEPPLTHHKYIKGRCGDAAFILKGFAGASIASGIITASAACKPGDVLILDEEDWKVLKEAVEKPKVQMQDGRIIDSGFDGIVGPQLVPFGRAILDAKLEDPRKSSSK